MINKKVLDALNKQINREIYSAYFYLGMSSYAYAVGKKGVANWFKLQWKEELFHADKMFNYINEHNMRAMLGAIEEPPQDFLSITDLFKRTYEHEKNVTKLILDLVNIAKNENDTETVKFLDWYVKEQSEEEAAPAGILMKLEASKNSPSAMANIDAELAKRK